MPGLVTAQQKILWQQEVVSSHDFKTHHKTTCLFALDKTENSYVPSLSVALAAPAPVSPTPPEELDCCVSKVQSTELIKTSWTSFIYVSDNSHTPIPSCLSLSVFLSKVSLAISNSSICKMVMFVNQTYSYLEGSLSAHQILSRFQLPLLTVLFS